MYNKTSAPAPGWVPQLIRGFQSGPVGSICSRIPESPITPCLSTPFSISDSAYRPDMAFLGSFCFGECFLADSPRRARKSLQVTELSAAAGGLALTLAILSAFRRRQATTQAHTQASSNA